MVYDRSKEDQERRRERVRLYLNAQKRGEKLSHDEIDRIFEERDRDQDTEEREQQQIDALEAKVQELKETKVSETSLENSLINSKKMQLLNEIEQKLQSDRDARKELVEYYKTQFDKMVSEQKDALVMPLIELLREFLESPKSEGLIIAFGKEYEPNRVKVVSIGHVMTSEKIDLEKLKVEGE
jgi:uncharacterized membrane-anchored protein YjiN (DUF445 family)